MLVGHGASGPVSTRRRRHPSPGGAHEIAAPPAARRLRPRRRGARRAAAAPAAGVTPAATSAARAEPAPEPHMPVIAKPPIRKLAKDLGVDLSRVSATGPIGDITRDDVIREASQASVFRNIQTPECALRSREPHPRQGRAQGDRERDGAERIPSAACIGVRRRRRDAHHGVSEAAEGLTRLRRHARSRPLLIMAKAMIWAVRRNPTVNAQWTDDEIIVKHYVNLGIAAATPRGLIVPNVKNAQSMSMVELAAALEQLTLTAREGKTQPAEMQGGTITITNIGVFGMDTGTPILNPGEVGIVALGTIKQKPWVVDGEVRPRFVTTIGGSFDHRVVDGDVVSRFVADVASIIEEPALLLE